MRMTNHTSMIIGFPSFIAFFKSPAKPRKERQNQRFNSLQIVDKKSTIETPCSSISTIQGKISKMEGLSSICKNTWTKFWSEGWCHQREKKERFGESVKNRLERLHTSIQTIFYKPLRTILHCLQNSVINSSGELNSLAHTGVDASGALYMT